MPTYDLTCRSCGHHLERFVPRMLRDDDRVCPVCGTGDMKTGIGGGVLGAGVRGGTRDAATCGPAESRFG